MLALYLAPSIALAAYVAALAVCSIIIERLMKPRFGRLG